jgi:flagellar P-ring protein precursor FlgI
MCKINSTRIWFKRFWAAGLALAVVCLISVPAYGVKVGDITKLKGSRHNKIVGFGLVTGLGEFGDQEYGPTVRALAKIHDQFASPVMQTDDLTKAGVALVMLEATLPVFGVREGDHVDISVTAVGSAERIVGGRLVITPLVSPFRMNDPPYGFASGVIRPVDPEVPTVGVIKGGGIMERDIVYSFIAIGRDLPFESQWVQPEQRYITLVLDDEHANPVLANTVAMTINGLFSQRSSTQTAASGFEDVEDNLAIAADPKNILVRIPPFELVNPIAFINDIQTMTVVEEDLNDSEARVVVNRLRGTIVITGNAEISPVAVSVRGLSISTVDTGGAPQGGEPFLALENRKPEETTKLSVLVDQLRQLRVPADIRIDVIEEIHKAGKLHAKLIRETE